MWRYLRAAFLVGVPVPGLGRLPVNAMAAFAVVAMGFVEPSVWLGGLGLEVALVGALAFNPRFQKVVDAQRVPLAIKAEADRRSELIAALPRELDARLIALRTTAARVVAICRKLGAEPEWIAGTEASLDRLEWIYLKLLIARDHLQNDLGSESKVDLSRRIETLRREIAGSSEGAIPDAIPDAIPGAMPGATLRPALQRSQKATLSILTRRLENLNNRDQLLKENESDLSRIEAQVALMRENAAIEGKPAAAEAEIELASDLGSAELFGVHGALVSALDEARSR